MSPDFVTWKDLTERLERFDNRLGRIEKIVYVLCAAVAVPKLGGPDPSSLVATVIHAVA